LKLLAREKVTILIGSTIADEGLDVPALKVLILAGSGKSSTRAFQRVGRVLRLFKGRNKAYVYDFMDMIPTFYKHYLYRKALYCTEPAWKNNMHWIKVF
jgi:superfamily II DNA or RNA helicase